MHAGTSGNSGRCTAVCWGIEKRNCIGGLGARGGWLMGYGILCLCLWTTEPFFFWYSFIIRAVGKD